MNIKTKLTASVTAIGLALAGCASTAGAETTAAAAPTGPALWQLSDEDTTVYLFGTVHVLPANVDWYDARIERAFTASDTLVTEVDLTDQAGMATILAEKAMFTDGSALRSLMSEENRAEYDALMTTLGLPSAAFDPFEPWFAALNLGVLPLLQAGYDPTSGVEMALEARAGDKTRDALESIDQQIALFDDMDLEYQLTYLDSTVESADELVPMIDSMVAEWLEGDADTLAEMMNSEMDDSYLYNRLLIDRNSNWVEWIEQRMDEPGTVFIAVGAGHLAGEGSVQDQLEQRGHAVTRITE
ncbi:TraB/GumN family protein [Alteraurantiacibacter aquimixticola]|uniref:TraB/GumN family protein n=1 Tax=Alteraurantiacibacter aquimixticola TaxID=2489173 RepID=A0A4T3EZC9_9SPHN|nr:TraB/GumN family protein [Alteraurantiacibacter aquimixticola]TIX50112.1 TraB/GumN family protein [Alteraurantiacibacter aquimixticola]